MGWVADDAVPTWDGRHWTPLSIADMDDIKKFATKAGAILSQTGLG